MDYSYIEASRDALVLQHEYERNADKLVQLQHQLRTTEIQSQTSQEAATAHIRAVQLQIMELSAELDKMAASQEQPQVPRTKLDQVLKETKEVEAMLANQQRELRGLEEVLATYSKDDRLQLTELMKDLELQWQVHCFQHLLSAKRET